MATLFITFLLCSSAFAQTILKVGNGTGFFVSPNEIVTAHHAIDTWMTTPLGVEYNGKTYGALVYKYNEHLDVAYLRIVGHSKVCDSPLIISEASLYEGMPYTLYGYPAKKNREFTSVSGVIKDTYYKMFSDTGRRNWRREFVQGSSGASSGYSGGPILDSKGYAIGVLCNGSRWNAYFTSFHMLKNHPDWKSINF